MDARTLYFRLSESGFALREEKGTLYVSPKERLTPEDRAAIAGNKPALLALCCEAELGRAEFAVWSAWWAKREHFGDTPPDDAREEARAASEECLALHARYMALIEERA